MPGACMAGAGMCGRGCLVEGVHGRGACMVGGVHGSGGMHGKGLVCMAGETATAVDGMHPTGMHSCLGRSLTSCMKMKEIGRLRGNACPWRPFDPPIA